MIFKSCTFDFCDYIKSVPTVWNATIPLWGEIGKNIAVARRNGDDYYVGIMSAGDGCEAEIDLSFLPEGNYAITEYSDGVNADSNAKDYRCRTKEVNRTSVIRVRLARNGGYAARIVRK